MTNISGAIESVKFYGLGKLGLALAAVFACSGLTVYGIDTKPLHVASLKEGRARHSEPGLAQLLQEARSNLHFLEPDQAPGTDATIILVPTPSSEDAPMFSSEHVLEALHHACRLESAQAGRADPHLIIISSTTMPGTINNAIRPILEKWSEKSGRKFLLAYVPDLVAIGDIVRGFRNPPCLFIGADDANTLAITAQLYRQIVAENVPIAFLTIAEAELTKIAWNFFFCMKISFSNMLLQLSAKAGDINVDRVVNTLVTDPRIGRGFLKAGMPFGGPCFPRDVDAMVAYTQKLNVNSGLAKAVRTLNQSQYEYIVESILQERPRRVGILGMRFKSGTPIAIESPSIKLAEMLKSRGMEISAFDHSPEALQTLTYHSWAAGIETTRSLEYICSHADVIVAAVDDPAYSEIAGLVPTNKTIIDPWGLVAGQHPGIRRLGRGDRAPGAL